MSSNVRTPAVAGFFYPDDPVVLDAALKSYLEGEVSSSDKPPRALIVPHAGYVYSGAVAAKAYATLQGFSDQYSKVVLIGPAHRVFVPGMALPETEVFATPLGEIRLDGALIEQLALRPGFIRSDAAHDHEHSLEVQLPFLQRSLPEFSLVPIAVGDASAEKVEAALEACLDDGTLLVISTDLSHYLAYHEARRIDQRTLRSIAEGDWHLRGEQACGCRGVNGLLRLAARLNWSSRLLDYRNSGDTAGDRDRVVGYAALVFEDA